MTSKEFVVWMQGFVEACNEYSPTPKQWDTLKDKLGEVKDERTTLTVSSGSSGTITYNPSTTTLWNPSGSAWSYTSTLPQQPTTGSNQLELEFETK